MNARLHCSKLAPKSRHSTTTMVLSPPPPPSLSQPLPLPLFKQLNYTSFPQMLNSFFGSRRKKEAWDRFENLAPTAFSGNAWVVVVFALAPKTRLFTFLTPSSPLHACVSQKRYLRIEMTANDSPHITRLLSTNAAREDGKRIAFAFSFPFHPMIDTSIWRKKEEKGEEKVRKAIYVRTRLSFFQPLFPLDFGVTHMFASPSKLFSCVANRSKRENNMFSSPQLRFAPRRNVSL